VLFVFHGVVREAPFTLADAPQLLTLAGWKAALSLSSLFALVLLVVSTVLRFVLITGLQEAGANLWSPVTAWLRLTGTHHGAPFHLFG
jgi:hypothetical protein